MKKIKKPLLLLSVFVTSTLLCACGGNTSSSITTSSQDQVGVQEVNFMSFNIRTETANDKNEKNWSYRRDYIYDYILNSGMDFLCLQEVRKVQYNDLSEGLKDKYNIVYYGRESGSNPEGLAICYSKDYELVEESMFWLSETPNEMSLGWGANYYRICVNVLVKSKITGQHFNLFNVHLDHESEESRNNGLQLILDKVVLNDYPTIVAGDFNTTNDSYCYTLINEYLYDCQQASPVTEEGMTFQNWGGNVSQSKSIDFIFVSEHLVPKEFNICQDMISENVYYSDHYAISAKLECE